MSYRKAILHKRILKRADVTAGSRLSIPISTKVSNP